MRKPPVAIVAIVAIVAALALPGAAAAAQNPAMREMCGLRTNYDPPRAGVTHAGFSALCEARSGCAIHGAAVEGHRLRLLKRGHGKTWRVLFALPAEADLSEGVELAVDGGEPQRIPPEFLIDTGGGVSVRIDEKLSDVVLEMLDGGKALTIAYTTRQGEKRRVTLSLEGLKKMRDWAACALGRLNGNGK